MEKVKPSPGQNRGEGCATDRNGRVREKTGGAK